MFSSSGNEKDIPRPERVPLRSIDELARSPNDDVQFVPGMRLLKINLVGLVDFHLERTVFEQNLERFIVSGKCAQGLCWSDMHVLWELVMR